MRLLVRATNWVGDAVMCLPALRALRERYPDAHVAILARPWVAGLYGREPFCDELIPYDVRPGARDLRKKLAIAAELRARRFDCAILLQNAFEAALVAWLARIPRRIGYSRDGRGWLLTGAIAVPKRGEIERHERFYYLELLRRAGLIDRLPASDAIRLDGAAEAAGAGRRRFALHGWTGGVVGVSPGAAYGSAKRWLPERFADAARRIGGPVALFGSESERALCAQVASLLGPGAVHNFAGETTLREFIELTAACRVFLTNDSGAMHIASALGVPSVAVFGATDHVGTGPTGASARIVRQPVDCTPYPNPCLRRECPIDHRCMKAVSAEQVAQVALDLLK